MKKLFVVNIFRWDQLYCQKVYDSLPKAIQFLLDEKYITEDKGSYMGNLYGQHFITLYGDNWREQILKLSLEDVNKISLGPLLGLKINELKLNV